MLHSAPLGSKGAAHASGWMTGTNFLEYLKHLTDTLHCSSDNKVLLILDNHDSHTDVRVLQYCKQNGIVLITLPPHCSHKLQPLDVTCFGPFKNFYNRAMDEWMLNHPGVPVTLYNIAETVGTSFGITLTPKNIIKGFQITGICPLNSELFQDADYLSSFVTDREQSIAEDVNNALERSLLVASDNIKPGCSNAEKNSFSFAINS